MFTVVVWWEWHLDEVRPVLYASLVYREMVVCWGGFALYIFLQPLPFVLHPSLRSDQPRHRQQSALQSSAHASLMRQHLVWSKGNRSEETTEQTSKPVPPLDTSASKIGHCPTHLPRVVVVVIHLNSPELRRRKWSGYLTFPRSNGTGRLVSSLVSVFTLSNSRLSTGMYWTWSKRAVTVSRVVRLSVLLIAAVQSCHRRCAVRLCSNRPRAIRNHASNRRHSSLVQSSNEPTTRDWCCCRPSRCRTRICRVDRRTVWTLSRSSCAWRISAWPVRKIISRVRVYRRWASWRAPWDCCNSRLRSTRPFPRCRRVPPSIWRLNVVPKPGYAEFPITRVTHGTR